METTLRIPIARLGRWYHPVYKNNEGEPVVEFTQEDFDSIKSAFKTNDRGYEPYLTYGHVKSNFDKYTLDGFPIEGHLVKLEQVEDVLYGDFRPNNPEVVEEVKSGKYRYASGEFVRNLPSKETGARIRVFLKGVALTNTPFVPNLPRNAVKLTSEDLTEIVLLSESMELGENTVQPIKDEKTNKCPECESPMENGVCSSCGYEMADQKKDPAMCSDEPVQESPENTQTNVVENTEDVKEIKSMLSEAMTWLKEFFGKKPTEVLAEETVTPPPAEVVEPEPETPEVPIQEETPMEDNKPEAVDTSALEAELAALKSEKAKLEAEKQELADRAAAFEQEKVLAEQAAKEQKLSEDINNLVEAGLAPAVAEKVRTLVSSSSNSVISLSETEQMDLGDAIVDLVKSILEPTSRVDLEQVGASADTATLSDDADNPWAEAIKKYRDKKSQ